MTKKELVIDMRRFLHGGGFISQKELATYLGYNSVTSVVKYTRGLEQVVGRKYAVTDIAESILNGGRA